MLEVKSYQKLKGYISQWVMGDARIPSDGLIWGESKRVMDRVLSKNIENFFWVRNVEWLGSSENGHTQIMFMWALDIEIAGKATRGVTDIEEVRLEEAHTIMMDFCRWLIEEHRQNRIRFEFPRLSAQQSVVGEGENNWGWAFTVYISMYAKNYCLQDEEERYSVSTYYPTFVAGQSQIQINIDGTDYLYGWTDVEKQGKMMQSLAAQINEDSGAAVTATTDEQYLYIKSKAINDPPTITLTPGEHTLTKLFE